MGYYLSEKEVDWLSVHFPGLRYDPDQCIIVGKCDFSLRYRNLEPISDSYDVFINLNSFSVASGLPDVREIRGRILRMSKTLGIDVIDLHCDKDGRLCLIRPDKVHEFYPSGFNFMTFMKHLQQFFYWVSFRYRYGYEPWPGEKHGCGD